MNKFESKAYHWIKNTYGLNDEQIVFHKNTSPDFSTPLGGFEVKKITHERYLYFTEKQIKELAENPYTIIIYEDIDSAPVILTFDKVKAEYKIVIINPADQVRIYANKHLLDELRAKYPETYDLTYTGLTDWALRKLLGDGNANKSR